MRGNRERRLEGLEIELADAERKPLKIHLLAEHEPLPDDYEEPPVGEINIIRLVGVQPGRVEE